MTVKPKGRAFCIDCPNNGKMPRPAPNPGPRCATHWREEKDRRKDSAHEKRVQKVYGLGPGDYERIFNHQFGSCYICTRAKGVARKLAVDHDHKTGLVRGLLCGPCNKILGHLRDDPVMAYRVVNYLLQPPAWELGIEAVHEDNRCDTCVGMIAGWCRDCGRRVPGDG